MTDAPAWTPGPWFIHEREGQTQRFGVTTSDNFDSSRGARRRIAFIGSPRITSQLDDEDRATATLIAAAPDLYEALASILTAIEVVGVLRGAKGVDLRFKCYEALKRARGESA